MNTEPTPTKRAMGDRGQGRKGLAAGVESVVTPIRLTPAQKAKLELLGGAAWIRERIDKARTPEAQ